MRRVAILALLVALLSPPARAVPPLDALGPVVVLAHRGASAYAPEHTFAAYDLAVAQDTDFLECDLQLTADEVLVCVHDTTVDRTTGGQHSGRVDAYTLEELRQMDFGSWFNPVFAGASIVPFEEQLDCYRALNPNLRFHIETKAPAEYGGRLEPLLVEVLEARGLVPDGPADPQTAPVIVQSFELASLEAIKAQAPSLPTAWLWDVPPLEALTGDLPDAVDVASPIYLAVLADPTFPARAHLFGHEVHTYTVDDALTMGLLLDLGVDGIFTNRPDVLRAVVDDRGLGVPAAERANPAPGSFPTGCPGVAGTVRAGGSAAPPTPAPPAPDPDTLPATGGGAVPWSAVAALALALAVTRVSRSAYRHPPTHRRSAGGDSPRLGQCPTEA